MHAPAPTSLTSIASQLRDGSMELLDYLNRVGDQLDAREPEIQALLPEPDRRARLLGDAIVLQRRFPDPPTRPPLFGIPIGVKDIYNVEAFETRAGSRLPPALFTGPEAAPVTALRDAGALVLGKTVTTEFAASEPGPTANPHNLAHTPGGSSSGSAAAVAAGYTPLALGSQTIGSVVRPAAFCGVVGFKPSYGRVSLTGVVPYAPSVDHAGWFVPEAADLALVASILVPNWQPVRLERAALPVLGIPVGPYLDAASDEGRAALERHAATLASSGYTVRRVAAFDNFSGVYERHQLLTQAELARTHAGWFDAHATLYRPRTKALVEAGRQVDAAALAAARVGRLRLRDDLEAVMTAEGIDLWISPPARGAAPAGLGSTGDPVMNLPWTHAGLPTLSIPAGYNAAGLPLGLQCSARFGADEWLLHWITGIADALQPLTVLD